MRPAHNRSGLALSAWPSAMLGTSLLIASTLAGAHDGGARPSRDVRLQALAASAAPAEGDPALLTKAIENLEAQAAKLTAQPGASCPQDFSMLDTGRPLRISMFYGYDDHDGKVYGRVNARSMAHVLMQECRGQRAACGFAAGSRSASTVSLVKTLRGRAVEVNLFTSAPEDDSVEDTGFLAAELEQERLSRAVKERFYRELVESDIVFYMGHSHLGGDIGLDDQAGVTTLVNSVFRLPMRPVLEALRQRPTRLKMIGVFSCNSNKYFRQDFEAANPELSLILTTGDINYGPAEQASLGALEAILSRSCGHGFHESMVSATESDRSMTYLFRGRSSLARAAQEEP